jgi:hypothetical protein
LSCVKKSVMYHAERPNLLPPNQYGGRPGHTATDTIHTPVNFIKVPLPISKSAAKQTFNAKLNGRTKQVFKRSLRYSKMKCINPLLPSPSYQKDTVHLPRRNTSIHIQLRSGHIGLNHHLHCIKSVKSPIWPTCNNTNETVDHYLFQCTGFTEARSELQQHFLIFYHHHPTVGIRPSCTMLSLYYLTPHP